MNVIDVTPRPAVVSAAVRFLQSPFMSILGIIFIFTALKWGTLLFVVPQYETVIITRFGKIVRTITTPGLKVKLPLIDKLQRFDKRILAWDGPPTECPTKDKLYIIVDCFARWRRKSSSACPASDTKSLRDSVPRDAAKRRTLVGKRKATWPRSVLMPRRLRLKPKAKPTPKPPRFTPQLLARLTSRNSIRFCA